MRKTSDVTDVSFPFADDRVPFVLVHNAAPAEAEDFDLPERGFGHASTAKKKIGLLEEAKRLQGEGLQCSLLAAWPGKTRTDFFHVDDLDEALAAFG